MGVMHLRLLGGFEVRLESGAQIDIPTRKAQAVLAYLALQPGKALSRDKLASLLWSDRGDKQAHGSLRQALTVLRKALETVDPPPLVVDRGSVAIEPGAIEVDAVAFDRLVAGSASGDLEAATALYQGDLLDGFVVRDPVFEEWLDCERERLHELMTRALTKLLDHKAANGAGDEAIALGQRLLTFDRLHESAHRTLMRLYAAQGQRDAALHQYERCRELLDRELGVEPEAETEALYQAICEAQPIPARTAVPIKAAASGMEPATAGRDWRWVVVALAVVLVAGIGMLAWLQSWAPRVEPAVEANMAFPLPDKPSIAVLPFANLSDDPEQEWFADGMTDDLITDLSQISGLFVIARNSSFTYKGRAVKVRQVAEELGVRYVLEGSVRRAGDQVRINAQLIDATTGGHMWAKRYDGKMEDVFALQDQVIRQIVSELAVAFTVAKQQPGTVSDTESIEAYEAFLKGWQHYRRFTPEDFANAVVHLKRAIELDPEYGRAHAALALTYQWALNLGKRGLEVQGQSASSARVERAKSLVLAQEYGPTSLSYQAVSFASLNHERSLTNAQRAVTLDPNDPEGFIALAHAFLHQGRHAEAAEAVETAMRLDPHYPSRYLYWLGMAKFHSEDFEEAATLIEKEAGQSVYSSSTFALLVAAYSHLGRDEDALRAIERWTEYEAEIVGRPRPLTTLGWWGWGLLLHYDAPGYLDRLDVGLRKVGLL